MTLLFNITQNDSYWRVEVTYHSPENFPWNESSQEFLDEDQYQKIADWCNHTFDTRSKPKRVRRMGYADFWFASKRDLDWFILFWSGVDNSAI